MPEVLPQYGPEPRPQSSEADAQSSSSSEGESEGSEEETEDNEATTGTWHMAASDEGYPYYWNDITAGTRLYTIPIYAKQFIGEGYNLWNHLDSGGWMGGSPCRL